MPGRIPAFLRSVIFIRRSAWLTASSTSFRPAPLRLAASCRPSSERRQSAMSGEVRGERAASQFDGDVVLPGDVCAQLFERRMKSEELKPRRMQHVRQRMKIDRELIDLRDDGLVWHGRPIRAPAIPVATTPARSSAARAAGRSRRAARARFESVRRPGH